MKYKLVLLFVGGLIFVSASLSGTSSIVTWVKDMYNQPGIKPQERETVNAFPMRSVAADGRIFSASPKPFETTDIDFSSYLPPENLIDSYRFNQVEGKRMFLTYCAVCHGSDAQLNDGRGTGVSKKGLKVVSIRDLPGGYYYERIRRGGVQMPSMAYRMTDHERWDIANYLDRLY